MEWDSGAGTLVSMDMLEQVCSRLCHDLAGPIGAIRNGLELIGDAAGPDDDGQALELIGHSAELGARRLRLFRLAYGRASRAGLRSFAEVRDTAQEWFAGSRTTLRWPLGQPEEGEAERPGLGRLLLNLVVLAAETIPHGGVVTVCGGGTGADAATVTVGVTGRAIQWPPELAAALADAPGREALGPRTIHAAMTGRFAAHYRLALSWETPNPETLLFRLSW
jgi:histidine phosphotransferase ChpT